MSTSPKVELREVLDDDVPVFFEQQLDPVANDMAAFTVQNPADREAFMAKWSRIRVDDGTTIRTIVADGEVAGNVMLWRDEELDAPEVSYWIGREFWGRGFATLALAAFLEIVRRRPLYGRAAKSNVGSIRVLEKCGFELVREDRGFANARGEEIDELVFLLDDGAAG
jgi:RimJ/RimL family protein N-acetyltransferase